jgi:hypothetical protein
VHGPGDDGNWDVESDQSDHDGQPEQEWNHPVLIFAMYDDTGDPPPEICQMEARRQRSTRLTQ